MISIIENPFSFSLLAILLYLFFKHTSLLSTSYKFSLNLSYSSYKNPRHKMYKVYLSGWYINMYKCMYMYVYVGIYVGTCICINMYVCLYLNIWGWSQGPNPGNLNMQVQNVWEIKITYDNMITYRWRHLDKMTYIWQHDKL